MLWGRTPRTILYVPSSLVGGLRSISASGGFLRFAQFGGICRRARLRARPHGLRLNLVSRKMEKQIYENLSLVLAKVAYIRVIAAHRSMPDHKPDIVSQKSLEGRDEILAQAVSDARMLQRGIQSLRRHPLSTRSDGGFSKRPR